MCCAVGLTLNRIAFLHVLYWSTRCDLGYAPMAYLLWSDRLLVFETGKHGYKELSQFLGVHHSGSEPYPRSNSTLEFTFVLNIMRVLAVLTIKLPALFVWYVCAGRKGPAKPKKP